MFLSKKILLSGIAAAALAMPALAEDGSMDRGLNDQGAIGQTRPNSGPGVQGAPDTRTGPATRAPGGDATTGASSGEAGASNNNRTTQPSQDSSGVQGFPDTRTGPATRSPEDAPAGSGAAQ
ncbi:MAG: hypothetical protein J0H65_02260 [Rhizobiales bacterium]|nr:hypothetical protein [Hyphomicrobiales bacterium]